MVDCSSSSNSGGSSSSNTSGAPLSPLLAVQEQLQQALMLLGVDLEAVL